MSELNATLSRQLTEVREQLAAIRAKMPDIIKIKSYSANYRSSAPITRNSAPSRPNIGSS